MTTNTGNAQLMKSDIDYTLDILQTLYVVLIALGFRLLALGFTHVLATGPPDRAMVARLLCFAAVGLTGFRFFWAVSNLRRYLAAKQRQGPLNARAIVLVHVPLLLLHSLFVYLVSDAYHRSCFDQLTIAASFFLGLTFMSLLLINVVWLLLLRTTKQLTAEERIWLANNGFFILLTFVAMTVLSGWGPYWLYCGVIVAMLGNGLVDLTRTASLYLHGNSVGGGLAVAEPRGAA